MAEYSGLEQAHMDESRAKSDKELLLDGAQRGADGGVNPEGATYKYAGNSSENGKVKLSGHQEKLHEEGEKLRAEYDRLKSAEFIKDQDSVIAFIDKEARLLQQGAIEAQNDAKATKMFVNDHLDILRYGEKTEAGQIAAAQAKDALEHLKVARKEGQEGSKAMFVKTTEDVIDHMKKVAGKYRLNLPPIDLSNKEIYSSQAADHLKRMFNMALHARLYELESDLGIGKPGAKRKKVEGHSTAPTSEVRIME